MDEKEQSLLQTINSPDLSVFGCIDLLRRYSSEIGVQFYLIKRLRTYKYEEIEFLIPQILQILVSFETNSMALEEFILEYCRKYPHFSLIVFWNLQAFVFELKDNPGSYSFQIVRNLVNKLQDLLFNPNPIESDEFRENLEPALILCGTIAASLGMPNLSQYSRPLVQTQAKQQKSFVFKLANFQKALTKNLTMKNKKLANDIRYTHSDDEGPRSSSNKGLDKRDRHSESSTRTKRRSTSTLMSEDSDLYSSDEEEEMKKLQQRKSASIKFSDLKSGIKSSQGEEDEVDLGSVSKYAKLRDVSIPRDALNQQFVSHSMPDLKAKNSFYGRNSSETDLGGSDNEASKLGENNHDLERLTISSVDKERSLRINYSKNVTEFILALQNVSLRLSQLPKEARLSALRAELSIINEHMLPSELDIPQLLPITSSRKKYHKLLKLSVNEACVLNSAERVPFLLFVEFLSDESDFDPATSQNRQILQANKRKQTFSDVKAEAKEQELESEEISGALSRVEADLTDLKIHSLDKPFTGSSSHLSVLHRETQSKIALYDPSAKTRADQMRIAAVMLQQLESSGQATSEQSASIKQRIVQSMIALQDQFDAIDYDKFNELKGEEANAGERKLENDFKLAEDWKVKKQRIRQASVYGHYPNWDLCSVIAKNGSDLPQEAFACQLIAMISNIWSKKKISTWTKRMKILITSANTGLVETITNAISIHSIKKSLTEISINEGSNTKRRIFTLKDYFEKLFGEPSSPSYKRAQENFAKSLASYSIICYVLQIKDRHNGNIMLDDEGHIIHIDFGFLLSNSPGSVGFEAAPFKLTMEYVDLLDGPESALFEQFKNTCKECFSALREESDQIVNMVEIMQKDSSLPCFNNGENTSVLLKQRLQLQLDANEVDDFVEYSLIGKSLGNMYTRLYDQFQLITQGIYS